MAKSLTLLLSALFFVAQSLHCSCQLQQWRNPVAGNTQQVDPELAACYDPKFVGPCRARVPKYYYSTESKQCELFFYGGCEQNRNNFETFEQCSSACTEKIQQQTQETTCTGPSHAGPYVCMAFMQRWSFNTTTKTCESVDYGGCGATLNNFVSEHDCILNCVDSKIACALPKDPGTCSNSQNKWWFNKDTGECQEFVYGGCAGNANKFESRRECQDFCSQGGKPNLDLRNNCEGVKCPRGGITHYKELGCTPIYDDGACCPTRYDCPDRTIQRNSSQCVYDGKLYNIGESISAADSGSGCRAGCACTVHGINCANVECPSNFGYYPKEDCRIGLYKPGQCCAHDFACGNETITCTFEGKSYVEGEKIYPKEEPCLKCYCKPGFNGTLSSEFCEEIDCGIQVWYSKELERGCTPVYFQDMASRVGCCPTSWHCPEDEEPNIDLNGTEIGQIFEPGPVLLLPNDVTPVLENNRTTNNSIILDKIQVTIQNTSATSKSAPHVLPIVLLENICSLPKAPGSCLAKRLRYFFNNETNQCEEFIYTGCKGNKNNFERLADCNDECGGQQELLPRFRAIKKPERERYTDPCTQMVSPGRCRAYFPRFYYDVTTGLCTFFIFGGCHRNDNNFYSKESCEATCLRTYPNVCDKKPLDLSKDCGGGNSTKFYYDPDAEVCKSFVSSGCSNANIFDRQSDCDAVCRSGNKGMTIWRNREVNKEAERKQGQRDEICLLPKKVGSCYATVPSYYYDVANASCLSFTYGGCFGNRNRFESLESCRQTCENVTTAGTTSIAFNEQPHRGYNSVRGAQPVPLQPAINQKPQFVIPTPRPQSQEPTSTRGENTNNSKPGNATPSSSSSLGPVDVESFIFARMGNSNSKPPVEDASFGQKPSPINNEFLQKPQDPFIYDEHINSFQRPQVEDPFSVHDDDDDSDLNTEDDFRNDFSSFSPENNPWQNFTTDNEAQESWLNFTKEIELEQKKHEQENPWVNFTHSFDNQSQQPWLNFTPNVDHQKLETFPRQQRPQIQPVRSPVGSLADRRRGRCMETLSTGNCSQIFLRFYWDGGSCRPFNYTGCNGNQNQFRTEYECRQTCDDNYNDVSSNLYCQFGHHIIPFGQNLNEDVCDTEFCTCIIPPSLTCTVRDCPQSP